MTLMQCDFEYFPKATTSDPLVFDKWENTPYIKRSMLDFPRKHRSSKLPLFLVKVCSNGRDYCLKVTFRKGQFVINRRLLEVIMFYEAKDLFLLASKNNKDGEHSPCARMDSIGNGV